MSVDWGYPCYYSVKTGKTLLIYKTYSVFVSSLFSGNEKYGFIVDNEDFTSKKLTTKLIQQIQVGISFYWLCYARERVLDGKDFYW